jgi:hypothetical protein
VCFNESQSSIMQEALRENSQARQQRAGVQRGARRPAAAEGSYRAL